MGNYEEKYKEAMKKAKEIIQSIKDNMCVIHKDKCLVWLEKQANIPHFTFDDILALQCAMKTAEKADNELYEQLKSLHDRLHDAYWLEKQGEHARFRESIQVGDKVTRNEAGDLVNLSQLERIAKPSQCESKHYVEVCGDNRFEIIEKAKKEIISSTNIETRPEEMAVLDSFLYRCWQMGWLERYEEQKPAWSEEDKAILQDAIYFISEYQKSNRCIDEGCMQNSVTCEKWLKSLKDRVQPQPKQEWSEEDSTRLYWVIQWLSFVKMYNNAPLDTKHIDEDIKWLKSLKPKQNQYDKGYNNGYSAAKYLQWKPSEEEMEALLYALGKGGTYNREALNRLYNNLKKL